MSEENDKKLYAHFKSLASGSMKTGNSVRDELIKSDGAKHLADLIKKRPNINFEDEAPVEEEPKKEEPKSKSKK